MNAHAATITASHVVQRDVVRQVEHAEQVAARHALQPVLAVRERRLQVEEDHLRQRERDHREIDALAADREQADDEPQQRGRRRAGEHAELRREAERLDRVAGRVAGAREEHRMAERQQPV
jgi:broad specificity phosphatase PhoE